MGDFISRKAVLVEAEKVPLRERNYRTFGNVVRSIPAADVMEVRHGRWIVSATNLHFDSKCSACGETFYSPLRGAYIVHHAKYCPNCGAKMDGKSADYAPKMPYDLLYEDGGPDA